MADNYIQDCGDIGISVSSGVPDSCEIVNNTLIRISQDGISLGAGTYDTDVSRWFVKGNTVRHFGIAAAGRVGIKLSTTTASQAWIEHNTVQAVGGNESYGIYVNGAEHGNRHLPDRRLSGPDHPARAGQLQQRAPAERTGRHG
jgi:hypothetical protein